MGVDSRTLNFIREELNAFLTDTCTIKKISGARDETGAPTGDIELVAEDVPCRVIDMSAKSASQSETIADQEAITERYRLVVPFGTELRSDYLIVLSDGSVWHVTEITEQRTDAMDTQAIIMREHN